MVAFRGRPLATAAVAAGSTVVYVLQAVPHPSRSNNGALSFVLVQAAYLTWLGLALALLSLLLARRDAAVRLLSDQRQRLVAEALTAEERERRQLAQELHDGAIQNLLAARHDLDLAANAGPGGPESRAHAAITATLAELRGAVADLHPYLLEQAGLAAAIGAGRARCGRARGIRARARRDATASPDRTTVRCCAARASCSRTSCGTPVREVSVALQRGEDSYRMRVRDDGVGFDPVAATGIVRAGPHRPRVAARARRGPRGRAQARERPRLGNRRHGDDPAGVP